MYYPARLGGNNMTKDEFILFERNTILLNENKRLKKENAELENKIADIKANCDLAIEGRDIKIKELELELTVEKDQHQEEINLHLHAEDYIKELEKENAELKEINSETLTQLNLDNGELIIENEKLRKENEELRNNGFTVSAMTEQQLKVALEKGEQLENELTKAKEIIRDLLGCFFYLFKYDNNTRGHIKINNAIEQAEQFLKEIEK